MLNIPPNPKPNQNGVKVWKEVMKQDFVLKFHVSVDLIDFEDPCPPKEIIWWDTIAMHFKFIKNMHLKDYLLVYLF